MISFRYHVVSLAAVLLALAAGILLGSGPLQGRSTPGPAEDDGGVSAAAALADLDATEGTLVALAGEASAGTLAGQTVALVALPGADPADVDAVHSSLAAAGAADGGRVTIDLTDASSAYLQTFTQQLAGYLPAPPAGAAPEGVLMAALVTVLTGADTSDGVLGELLVAGDTPLLMLADGSPATVVVAVGPRGTSEWDLAAMARALDGTPALVIGATTDAADGLVDALRAEEAIPATVNEVDGPVGPALAPLALAAVIGGESGHWGTGLPSPAPPLVR